MAQPERNYFYAHQGKILKINIFSNIAVKKVLLLKERICSHSDQNLSFKISLYFESDKLFPFKRSPYGK